MKKMIALLSLLTDYLIYNQIFDSSLYVSLIRIAEYLVGILLLFSTDWVNNQKRWFALFTFLLSILLHSAIEYNLIYVWIQFWIYVFFQL